MKYMIHSCNPRLWYVNDYLVPSMIAQGISKEDITVCNDDSHIGCRRSYIRSFQKLRGRNSGTWHLQDDVAISRDFAKRTAEHDEGIVYGFFHRHIKEKDLVIKDGPLPVRQAGYSFPCFRLPDEIAVEFADWFLKDAQYREEYSRWLEAGKYVDAFFLIFLQERYSDGSVYMMRPSIVEHVDWLIGGSMVNKWREEICRATYWEDESVIDGLKRELAHRN